MNNNDDIVTKTESLNLVTLSHHNIVPFLQNRYYDIRAGGSSNSIEMADIPQSSKFDWTVSFAPSRNLISVPLSSRKDTDTSSSEANCNDFDSTKLQRYHVHMKVGRAQSEPSNTSGAGASPPPVPPRLGKPFHHSPRPASQYLQPVSAMTSELQSPRRREAMRSTDLQTARKRREAVNKVKRQRHMSVPIFEEWNLRKESKPSADEATVLTSTSKVDSQTLSDGSVAIKLSQFILQYAHMLPLRVKIVQGYGSTLCTGRSYNIHFIKQLKVVHVKDMAGCQYHIPFNSSARFGLVYSPAGIRNECYVFDKVNDIIDAAERPKLVVATKSVRPNKDYSDLLIMKNEVLIIQEVHKSQLKLNQKLRVFSYTANLHKDLSSDVYGKFTTDPSLAPMYLPDLLKLFQKSLPLKTRLYMDTNGDSSLPDILTKEVVTLERVSTETSLIASAVSESELAEDPETFEIKASIPVTVVVESVECEILYERTQTLFRNFNAAAKVATISSHADSSQHSSQRNGGSLVVPVQERLYQEVRSTEGVSIIPPRVAVSPHREENASDKGSEHSDNSNPLPPEHIYQPLDVSTMEDSVYEPLSPSSMNSCTCSDVFLPPNTSEMAKLVEDLEKLREQCSMTVSAVNQLKLEVSSLKEQLAGLVAGTIKSHQEDTPQTDCAHNIEQLRALDNSKILELLDKMKLSQYKEAFSKECITGEIMAECDESIFENELCIKNRIHRIRLLKIVNGHKSVMSC